MTRKSRRAVLLIIGVIVAAGLIAGYLVWNKPHKDVKHASSVTVSAVSLYDGFVKDSANAGRLYSNKVLDVTGEITRTGSNQQGQQLIFLKTNVADAAINCTMEENDGALKAGDQVIIRGICSGYIAGDADMGIPGDVFLVRGYHHQKK